MRTVEEILKRLDKIVYKNTAIKSCPICGCVPRFEKRSLDRGNGHGYPGHYIYYYECSGCGLLKSIEANDIYDDEQNAPAPERTLKDWNELVNCVNNLIDKTRG